MPIRKRRGDKEQIRKTGKTKTEKVGGDRQSNEEHSMLSSQVIKLSLNLPFQFYLPLHPMLPLNWSILYWLY